MRRGLWVGATLALSLLHIGLGHAQTESSERATGGEPSEVREGEAEQARAQRDEREQALQLLMIGRLDPEIDLDALFATELDDPDAQALLRDEYESKTSPFARWGRLSSARKMLLIESHRARRNEHLASQAKKRAAKVEDERAAQQAEQLEAYLAGGLEPDANLAEVLAFPLLAVRADDSDGSRKLNAAREKYAALDLKARKKLREVHKKNRARQDAEIESRAKQKKAEEESEAGAALRQKEALEEAERAASESARLVAEERARLFGVQGRLVEFEKDLEQLETRARQRREELLAWTRKVRELSQRDPLSQNDDSRVWTLYQQLVDELTEFRRDLRGALSGLRTPPAPEEISALPDLPEIQKATSLRELDDSLRKNRAELVTRSRRAHAEAAATLRDQTVDLNEVRLRLLGELNSFQQSELAGLGPDGIAQVRREFDQMQLEGRYHLLTTHAQIRSTMSRQDRVVLFFALLKLAFVVVIFRAWRARAPAWLAGFMDWGKTASSGPFGQVARKAAWYAQRLRAPVEWYLLLATSVAVAQSIIHLPEVAYLEEVITWICLGSFAVRWADALGADFGQAIDRTHLRFRSLRLVATGIVTVFLLLRLAELSVGQGALFTWISRVSLAWMVIVIVRLLFWWRPLVLSRVAGRAEPSRFYLWAKKRKSGPVSLLVTLIVGSEMILETGYRFVIRRVTHLQSAQRFLAYLFRKELEKRNSAEEDKYEPADAEVFRALETAAETAPLVESYAGAELKRCTAAISAKQGAIIALTAERGLGKTRFAQRVCDVVSNTGGDDSVLTVKIRCARPGYESLLKQLADALGSEGSASEEAVVELIHSKQPAVIAIDDATRLIRPFIGGLRDFDRLAHLARQVGVKTSWLLGISNASFNYLSRAREGRAVVDLVVRLPEWSEMEIMELTRKSAEHARQVLKYDDLVIPNQMQAGPEEGSLEQTERDYCRMLWDFADGNPSIALYFFRHSVRKREGEHHVRLFHQPPAEALEEHPTSVLFVLRSVLQLGIATEGDVVRCTGLPGPEVADALRLARGRKYVRFEGGRYAITVEWYRMVTQILRRQHLLIE